MRRMPVRLRCSMGFALIYASLMVQGASGVQKERVYTMGDDDPGAVAGGTPPVVTTVTPNRIGTVDIQPSTTDYGTSDPLSQTNFSLVPMISPNANFSPRYVDASDRPGAAAGNLALAFDGANDFMQSSAPNSAASFPFDPRNFGGSFVALSQAWVKPTSTSITADQFIFRVGRELGGVKITADGFWALRTGDPTATVLLEDVEAKSNVPVALNEWTHVAVLRGGNASTLYVNGSVAALDPGFWGSEQPGVMLGVDFDFFSSLFTGAIDNFNIAGFAVGGFTVAADIDYFVDRNVNFSGVAGDVDQDGDVDADDYKIWSQNVGFDNGFGQGDPGTLLKGDVNQSGRVDLRDFQIIKAAALAAAPATGLGVGVPEPASLFLLLSGLAPLWLRRVRRARTIAAYGRTALPIAAVVVAASLAGRTSATAAVIVADDFLYDGSSKALHVGGGFNGLQQYRGGQNGPAGNWTGQWGQIGDGVITTPEFVPPIDPFDQMPESLPPFHVALYDGFFGVQSELFRGFALADSVSPTQTLYFGGRFKVDLEIGTDDGVAPQFYAPRLFLNRIAGDDRAFDLDGMPIANQRNRSQDIALGIQENMVVARLGAGPEVMTVVPAAPPDDGEWHTLVGKLELNVAGGANERLSVWIDPTGVETGGAMAQIEADILTDLGGLIGTLHSQGSVPIDPPDPELGRAYIDDMAIGTAWQDVVQVDVPRLALRINPATGAGRIVNATGATFELDAYSIESASGALNGTGWNSLDEQNVGDWQQNVATSSQLVESSFTGSTTVAPGGQLSLGNLFTVGASQQLVGRYSTTDGLINLFEVEFAAGQAGNYDGDGDVDGGDFLVWQRTLGMNVAPGSGADGDGNGVIGPGDLTVWRNNFGQLGADAAAAALPEPAAGYLACAGLAMLAAKRRRRVH